MAAGVSRVRLPLLSLLLALPFLNSLPEDVVVSVQPISSTFVWDITSEGPQFRPVVAALVNVTCGSCTGVKSVHMRGKYLYRLQLSELSSLDPLVGVVDLVCGTGVTTVVPLLPCLDCRCAPACQVERILQGLNIHSAHDMYLSHETPRRWSDTTLFAGVVLQPAGFHTILESCRVVVKGPDACDTWPPRWLEFDDGQVVEGSLPPTHMEQLVATSTSSINLNIVDPHTDSPTAGDQLSSYLQETATGFPPPPPVTGMMKAVIGALMPPVMGIVNEAIGHQLTNEIGRTVQPAIDTGSVEEIVTIVSPPVARNVSNLAIDAITYYATRKTSSMLVDTMAPPVATTVAEGTYPGIREHLNETLSPAIEHKIDENLPMMLKRSVPMLTTHKLTHSVTNAVVSSLSHTMQDTRPVEYFCDMCSTQRELCDYCKMSDKNFYSSYYGTYYSDHFAKYYADYYVPAMLKVDAAQFDPNK